MNDSNEQELCVRIVLREPNAAEIHKAASKVSDPDPDKGGYGRYEDRKTIAKWGNPSAETRQRVLSAFGGVHEPSLLDQSPLLFVQGRKETFEGLFQGEPLERIHPVTSPVVQIRSWEWNEALSDLEHAVKTVHVSLLRDATKSEDAPPPNRGWLFPQQRPGRRALGYRRDSRQASRESDRLEDGATPALLRRIYNFPEGFTGKGQTVAIMSRGGPAGAEKRELDRHVDADMALFWREFGIRRKPVRRVQVGPSFDSLPATPLDALEATMGPSWIGAMLPDAEIVLYEMSLDLPDPWLAAVEAAVADDQNRPSVLCITWTTPEEFYYRQFSRASISLALAKAAALGITVVTATGDWGVYDGRPASSVRRGRRPAKERIARAAWPHATFPSTEERVLSVGGTMLSSLEPLAELGWSGPLPPDPELAKALPFINLATSGGFSQRVPIPEWQEDAVAGLTLDRVYSRGSNTPAVLAYGRGYPDVAAMAAGPSLPRGNPPVLSATGYALVVDGTWINYAGGTSMAAPIWASVIAIVNEQRARAGRPALGFVNPVLYHLGATRPVSGEYAVLRQVVDGNSDIEFRVVNGEGDIQRHVLAGYRSRSEWDPVTGLGVPNVKRLADSLTEYPVVPKKPQTAPQPPAQESPTATVASLA
jgi:kumamolisin